MAKKPQLIYRCHACGATHPRWVGQCSACGEWNTLVEEAPEPSVPKGLSKGKAGALEVVRLNEHVEAPARLPVGTAELDRVLGGGFVPGAAILIGGDPGIGKSTLLLQVAAAMAGHMPSIYISGEESTAQVQLRARRLGLADAPVQLASAASVRDILALLKTIDGPGLVVIDSIQTMYVDSIDSAPGTVTQVRSSAAELVRLAKKQDLVLVLVGHVTKEGQLAGPRVLEHMVDTVLYFEGEHRHLYRLLRAVKNRFGAAGEIGVFAMQESGLQEVANPSALFLPHRERPVSGAAVYAGLEGSRPVLLELEALVAPCHYATPRRAVVGWESGRLAMLLAVLETRAGMGLSESEVYLNVAGGYKVADPAADLAAAAALISARQDMPLPADTVLCGEIGLSGDIRPVAQLELRLREAAKLGFRQAIIPQAGELETEPLNIRRLEHIDQLPGYIEHTP